MKGFAFLALLAVASAATAPFYHEDAKEIIPGEYLVALKNEAKDSDVSYHVAKVQRKPGTAIPRQFRIGKLIGYHLKADKSVVQELLSDPLVQYIEPNQVMRAYQNCKDQTMATWGIVRTTTRQLDVNGIFPHQETYGEGVDAYVIDTGIYTQHNDFGGRAVWGTDTVDTPSPETDENGHGTHVAGTIISNTYGLSRSATAIAVKVLNRNGSGSTAGVIAGIEYVTQEHKKKSNAKSVANMSLGGGRSTIMNQAVDESVAAGVVHVVAAGNEGQDACNVSPASAESAITVACSDNQDNFCSFSNHGTCVDMIAPGRDVTSTWIGSPVSDNTISGTSMSSPHVAGIAAKIMSESSSSMTPAQVLQQLTQTSTTNEIKLVRSPTPNRLVFGECA